MDQVRLSFIVNGEDVEVEAGLDETLHGARDRALAKSHNTSIDPAVWEIRLPNGSRIEARDRVSEVIPLLQATYHGALFLTLPTGCGG